MYALAETELSLPLPMQPTGRPLDTVANWAVPALAAGGAALALLKTPAWKGGKFKAGVLANGVIAGSVLGAAAGLLVMAAASGAEMVV